jgi:hypothetical protein
LSDLALVTGLDEPLDVSFEHGPPEAIKEDAACGVEALVAEIVMSITDEGVPNGGMGIKLVPATLLSLPKLSSCDEEVVCSANKMCQHVGR